MSGDIEMNPGPVNAPKYPCKVCEKNVRSNPDAILCTVCDNWSHAKCLGMSKDCFKHYLFNPEQDWARDFCALSKFNNSFFEEDTISTNQDQGPRRGDEASTQDSGSQVCDVDNDTDIRSISWFQTNVRNYYKSNLIIGHLNINSIYNKLDEVKDLLNKNLFDILFLAEPRLMLQCPIYL